MNVLRNLEAVFVVTLGMAVSACYVLQAPGDAAAPQALGAHIATPSKMAVVSVSARRLSAAEKQRSIEDERRLARQGATANRI